MSYLTSQARVRRWPHLSLLGLLLVLLLLVSLFSVQSEMVTSPLGSGLDMSQIELPLSFVPNAGQSASPVAFQANDANAAIYFSANEVLLELPKTTSMDSSTVSITFEDANPATSIEGQGLAAGRVSFLLGDNPNDWLIDLPTYENIRYESLYPGIALTYDGTHGVLKGTYHVAPGADPNLISWRYTGVESVTVDNRGNLQLALPGENSQTLVEQTPIAWQDIGTERHPVQASYVLEPGNVISFRLGNYDSSYPLVIDPTLIYSLTLGGNGFDLPQGIAVDQAGNTYITGLTTSSNYPTKDPVQSNQPGIDIFVTKIDPSGQNLVYSTYIGGSEDDEGYGIVVDDNGLANVVGSTDSKDLPLANPLQDEFGGLEDAFVITLNAAGNDLVFGTYLGGKGIDEGEGIALDDDGALHIVGYTSSQSFPTVKPWQSTLAGPMDAFLTKINSSRSAIAFSTYLGGKDMDLGAGVAADDSGIYVAGETFSNDFPVKNAFSNQYAGLGDVFLTKFAPDGQDVLISSFLGGDNKDSAYGVAVHNGQPAIVGATESGDFPSDTMALTSSRGNPDAFVTQFMASGGSLAFSTVLGGSDRDQGQDIAINEAGAVYVTGQTFSADFPVKDPLQAQMLGTSDAFVAKLENGLLVYSTFLGGSSGDSGTGIAASETDLAYVVGNTESDDFPQSTSSAPSVAFVAKLQDEGGSLPPTGPNLSGSYKKASANYLEPGEELTFTIRLLNNGGAATTADVVDELPEPLEYVTGSVSGGGVYDSSTGALSWSDVSVDAGEEVLLTFDVTASVDEVKTVTNTAEITPSGKDSFERSATVVLLPKALPDDPTPPEVLSVQIDEKDVLTDSTVTLHIEASDNESVDQMFIKEFWLATKPVPRWETVQSSDWIPYESETEWDLIEESGTHYVVVWVSDEAGNVSIATAKSIDFASLLLPDASIHGLGLVPYMVEFAAGESVMASLTPSSGDADLFVWYPNNFGLPDQVSTNDGTSKDEVSFVAPETGTYLFVVFGYVPSTYDFAIVPGGGMAVDQQQQQATQTDKFIFPNEPVLSQSGLDPLANIELPESPTPIGQGKTHTIAFPIIAGG